MDNDNFYYKYIVFVATSMEVNYNCTDYDVKLVNGAVASEGKILICINGLWGLLCSSYLSSVDANVICRQLGYIAKGT